MLKLYKDHCEVCKQKISKYRCTTCKQIYCSLECKNNHNCQPINTINFEDIIQQNKFSTPLHQAEDDIRVPKKVLEKLKESTRLREKLKSEKLRQVILKIDRSDQKFRDLTYQMKVDEDFEKFIYEMLEDIGYLDKEGQFKF